MSNYQDDAELSRGQRLYRQRAGKPPTEKVPPPSTAEKRRAAADAQRHMRAQRKAERIVREGRWVHPEAPHGTYSSYVNYVCRCVLCEEANTEAHLTMYQKRKGNSHVR